MLGFLVGDRSFTPDSHCEVHEEDIEFWWFPNLPTDAHTKAMERLRKKVERSRNGLQVWFSTTDGKEYNEYVNMKDIFEKTPSQIIIQTLKDLKKVSAKNGGFNSFLVSRTSFRFYFASGWKTHICYTQLEHNPL